MAQLTQNRIASSKLGETFNEISDAVLFIRLGNFIKSIERLFNA